MDNQFLRLMKDKVQLQVFDHLSTDGYGARVYQTATTCYARVESHVQLAKDPQHKDVVSTVTVFLPMTDIAGNAINVGVADKITLPSTYGVTGTHLTPPIIWVERHNDDKGPMYWRVLI